MFLLRVFFMTAKQPVLFATQYALFSFLVSANVLKWLSIVMSCNVDTRRVPGVVARNQE